MAIVTLVDWKQYIAHHPQAHLLQTAEWGELKASFGWEATRVICGDYGVQLLFRKLPLGQSVAYLPKPLPGMPGLDPGAELWEELMSVCRRKRAVFLKIEPDHWDQGASGQDLTGGQGASARMSAYNVQPPRTLVVDLGGSEEDILGRMKQKCRYNIRLAEKKDVAVRPWNDLDGFHALMQATSTRDGFAVHSADYYRKAYELFHPTGGCELLVAEFGGAPLAALMVFRQGSRAWYLYGASNDAERNRMPTYLVQWRAMLWAKAHGCEQYDLWGVPDEDESALEANFERRHDGLWGVYRFKRGFGGQLRRAAQAMDVVFNPLLYRLYTWRMAGREAA